MKTLKWINPRLLILFFVVACGGDSGGGGGGDETVAPQSGNPENEEICLTETEQETATSFFDTVWNRSTAVGSATFKELGQSRRTTIYDGSYDFNEENAKWITSGRFCELIPAPDDPSPCIDVRSEIELQDNGCLYVDGEQAEVTSLGSNSIDFFTLSDDGIRNRTKLSVDSNDLFNVESATSQQGNIQTTLNFKEFAN